MIVDTLPRSIEIHCGSTPSRLPQREDMLPSTALSGVKRRFSIDEASVGFLFESKTDFGTGVVGVVVSGGVVGGGVGFVGVVVSGGVVG